MSRLTTYLEFVQRSLRLLGFALVAVCVACVSGCRSHVIRIAVIPQTTGTPLWSPVLSGAQSVARKSDVSIYWNAPTSEDNIKAQIALLERVIHSKRYDGIILAPDHSLALMSAVQDAEATGIPVVVISSRLNLPPGPGLSYVLNNDTKGGQMAAQYLGKLLQGHGSVAVMGIDPALDGNMRREHSFEATLRKDYPAIKIAVRDFGAYNVPHETHVAAAILKRDPEVTAIVALNPAAERGVWNTLLAQHKTHSIKVVGFDQDMVLDGEHTIRINAIVTQNTFKMGQVAVRQILNELHHKRVPPLTWISPQLLTQDPQQGVKSRSSEGAAKSGSS